MKNFFKSVAIAAALFAACRVYAQTYPAEEILIIEPFTCAQESYNNETEPIRGAVISGLSNIKCFHVIDALSDTRLSALFQNRKYEDVVTDQNWMTESATAYKSLKAKRIIKGQLELVKEYTKVDKDGKKWYIVDTNITLQVFSITKGTMVSSELYNCWGWSSTSYSNAFEDALSTVENRMNRFAREYIMELYVLKLGDTKRKKDKPIDLWISGGKNCCCETGDIFHIIIKKKIGPKIARMNIGKVIAEEVTENMTRCKITTKESREAIATAFKEGKTLHVIYHTPFIHGTSILDFLKFK